jgi:putative transposase
MKKTKFSEEKIAYVMRQVEAANPLWKCAGTRYQRTGAHYSIVGRRSMVAWESPRLRRLRQLEEENSKLKQLVADLSLDKHMLQEVITKKL